MIYNIVKVLVANGFDACLVHNSPGAGHPDYFSDIPAGYTRKVELAGLRWAGRRRRAKKALARLLPAWPKQGALQPVKISPDDIIVCPEFMFAEAALAFPRNRLIIFAQNPFSFISAYLKAQEAGVDTAKRVSWYIGISDVNDDAFALVGATPTSRFVVSPELNLFPYQAEKKPIIAYMPRKRPSEARLIHRSLERRGLISDYTLYEIDGVTRNEVAAILKDTRIFISLLHQEALGFPAAEAMAAGCITVGYTGLGTREYFNSRTGFEVTEGDTFGVVKAVEDIVNGYAQDPAPYDTLRQFASECVHSRYAPQKFENELLKTWREIDVGLSRA